VNWKEEYKRKLVTAKEAVKIVKSGDKVGFGFPRQPYALNAALAARSDELENVEMLVEDPRIDDGWLHPEKKKAFSMTLEFFIGPTMRKYTDSKEADYLPVIFSMEPKIWQERAGERKDLDVYMAVVTPPDEHGFCSFGHNLWNKRTCAQAAHKVIMEVDTSMIRTYGSNYIHVSEVDYFVENTLTVPQEKLDEAIANFSPQEQAGLREIWSYFTPQQRAEHFPYLMKDTSLIPSYRRIFGIGEIDPRLKAIAENVKPLIHDGDCIQVGVAGVGSYLARLGVFDDRVDLGYHGEMASRGIGNLIEAGVINGRRKTIHKGKAIFDSLEGFGPEELEYANNNPLIELYDAEYVVNINTISSNANMVAMNTIMSVDLTGQINCETTFGGRMINGTGGQPESYIGAVISPGGRAISLLYSTALDGAVSAIVPRFEPGTMVTIPRYLADYVVTEYGVARLMGKPVKQRAEELISIAHPDFRVELRKAAQDFFRH